MRPLAAVLRLQALPPSIRHCTPSLQQPLRLRPICSARFRGAHGALHRALYVNLRGDNLLRLPTRGNDVHCDGEIEG